ncbi:MAG TPA: TonB-dependent receptor, partial [Vicinamibacterales bacterium]|nr:TonB-dependent receptor [Vicinamibacterales bacterium]
MDGFRGGKLPPKSQIRSIRFSSGMFSAENHTAGMTFVDVVTQPGLGPLQVGLDSQFRTGALNARNAFQPVKGPEQTQQYSLNLAGTLVKNRTSFNLAAGGASLYDSANLFAATPAGDRLGSVRRPADRLNVSGRIDQVLSKNHTLRVSFQQDVNDQQGLGVGTFDLPDRAYSRDATDRLLRISESGPLAKNWFGDSRLQVHSTSASLASAVRAPTVRVLDAFTSGGAQQDGSSDSTEVEWATNVDYARKQHAIRVGTLLDGGTYRSGVRTNAFGTFTFPTLADYEAGRPSLFTERIGDPAVRYSMWQFGAFAQDDWRARTNLTVSGGLRYEVQSHAGGAVNLAPRGGITWAPFKSGRTTIRAGAGIFYDWMDADTYGQTLQVDGVRQQDLVVVDPSYPDPFAGGAAAELPPSRYALGAGLVLPRREMAMVGVTQQLVPNLMMNVMFNRGRSDTRLRGRNVNAPVDGVRPDPASGNVVEVESVGRSHGSNLNVGINYAIPQKHLFLFANYAWLRQYDDADGPFSLPADNDDLAA